MRELLGLTYYRLGRWKDAVRELEAFRALTGSTEQHPVLADCYRALHRWSQVDELWHELREASPAPDLVSEGRIVAAGALAEQGDLPAAVRLLERDGDRPSGSPPTICGSPTRLPTCTSDRATSLAPVSCSAGSWSPTPTSPTPPNERGPSAEPRSGSGGEPCPIVVTRPHYGDRQFPALMHREHEECEG